MACFAFFFFFCWISSIKLKSFFFSVCAGSRTTQPTSSVDIFNIDVQCNDSSDKNHQLSMENEHSNDVAGKFFSALPELQGQCDYSRVGLNSNQECECIIHYNIYSLFFVTHLLHGICFLLDVKYNLNIVLSLCSLG